MKSIIPIIRMYTDETGFTRFARMGLPLIEKTGLGSVGHFSSLFVNENILDNAGDVRMQFGVTPIPENIEGEGPKLAHTAPRKQLVITLGGNLEFKSCGVDKEDPEYKVMICPGDILLAEDLEGKDHVWRFVEDSSGNLQPWERCYIHLGEEYDHFVSQLVSLD